MDCSINAKVDNPSSITAQSKLRILSELQSTFHNQTFWLSAAFCFFIDGCSSACNILLHEQCGAHSSVIKGSTSLGRQRCFGCFSSPWWDSQNYCQTVRWCRAPGFLLMHDNASLNSSLKCASRPLIQPKSWAHHACHCLTGTDWCPHPVQRRSSFFWTISRCHFPLWLWI